MDEYFLQFLWKFQKFSSQQLFLSSGEKLTVYKTGYQNFNSGPDFQEAKLQINELTWSGSVEIHYRSSDWFNHKHDKDQAYENVILHVVWINDKEVPGKSGTPIPTFEIGKYVTQNLQQEYRKYINQPGVILCRDRLPSLSSIQSRSMLDGSFAARLREKGKKTLDILQECENDWEETTYRLLAANFGFKINAESFSKLARSLPYKILRKHLDHSSQVEALLFGMAGFLETPADAYAEQLQAEFRFLSRKYQLSPILSEHHWKLSRLRPANFPTIRLVQFSALLQGNSFSTR